MARITESQLVLPALYLLSKSENGFVSTSYSATIKLHREVQVDITFDVVAE